MGHGRKSVQFSSNHHCSNYICLHKHIQSHFMPVYLPSQYSVVLSIDIPQTSVVGDQREDKSLAFGKRIIQLNYIITDWVFHKVHRFMQCMAWTCLQDESMQGRTLLPEDEKGCPVHCWGSELCNEQGMQEERKKKKKKKTISYLR